MNVCLGWLSSGFPVPIRDRLGKSTLSLARCRCRKGAQRRIHATAAPRPRRNTNLQRLETKIWLPDERHTYRLGRLLAEDARPGDVLLLHGELGAGKTSVARGYIHAARRDDLIEVTSPTYLLTNVYPPEASEGPSPAPKIYHMDLWRLESASDRPLVDFERVFSEYISLIEWPDRLKNLLPSDRLDIQLEYPPSIKQDDNPDDSDPWGFETEDFDDYGSSKSGRFVALEAHGDIWRERVAQLIHSTSWNDEGRRILPGA